MPSGPGVYGYWRSAAAYVACMPPFGWSCFLCDLAVEGEAGGGAASASAAKACDAGANLRVTPRDAFGRRAYLAPLGLTVTVEGGRLVEVELQPRVRRAVLRVAAHERARSSEARRRHLLPLLLLAPPSSAAWRLSLAIQVITPAM